MPEPLASEGAPAWRESQHQRKVGSTPPDPTFSDQGNGLWEPYPTLCSCLHFFSTSRAKPLILLKDLHLWLQQTVLATCNLPSQCASFQRAPGFRGTLERLPGRLVGRVGIVRSLVGGRIWEVTGPLCTSFVCSMGVIIVFTARRGCVDQMS